MFDLRREFLNYRRYLQHRGEENLKFVQNGVLFIQLILFRTKDYHTTEKKQQKCYSAQLLDSLMATIYFREYYELLKYLFLQ